MYETALSPLLLPAGPPKTRLLDQMAATPRYRSNGLPEDTRDVVIFADRHNAVEACEAVAAHCPQAVIAGVCVHKGETSSITARIHGETRSLPVLAPDCLRDFPHCLAVLYWSGCIVPDLLYHLETVVRSTLSIALFPRIPMGTGRKRDAALYTRHRDILERIYAELGDDESRLSFASVIKGLLTGEVDRPPCRLPATWSSTQGCLTAPYCAVLPWLLGRKGMSTVSSRNPPTLFPCKKRSPITATPAM